MDTRLQNDCVQLKQFINDREFHCVLQNMTDNNSSIAPIKNDYWAFLVSSASAFCTSVCAKNRALNRWAAVIQVHKTEQ